MLLIIPKLIDKIYETSLKSQPGELAKLILKFTCERKVKNGQEYFASEILSERIYLIAGP